MSGNNNRCDWIVEDLKEFISPIVKRGTLKDKLIVINYMILMKKAHSLSENETDIYKNITIDNYFMIEDIIGTKLSSKVRRFYSKKELAKITKRIKKETEVLKRKIKDVKRDKIVFEEESEIRERLKGYINETSINEVIECYKRFGSIQEEMEQSRIKMNNAIERAKTLNKNKTVDFTRRNITEDK